jgi:cell wall-associated NlpC family hydrolase
MNARLLVRELALQDRGLFYTWGGDDPSGFDCSGFVIEILKSVGVLPRQGDWTAHQLATGFGWRRVDPPQEGDLVFWHSKQRPDRIIHVEICINSTLSIGASGGGSRILTRADAIAANAFIKVRPITSRGRRWGFLDPYKQFERG